MTEKLLKQMSAIVDSMMSDNKNMRSDFYRYDLQTLYAIQDNENVVWFWEVNPSHTHLLTLDEKAIKKNLEERESARFIFGQGPDDAIVGGFILWTTDKDSRFFMFQDGAFSEVIPENSIVNVGDIIMQVWSPMRDRLVSWLEQIYPNEQALYHKRIPVYFANSQIFAKALDFIRHNDKGETLLRCLRRFHNYRRVAANQKIVVGNDFDPRSFSFAEIINGKYDLCGGLIYSQGSGWSSHT